MRYISETEEFKLENSAVTLGKFDGLHLGHQLLMKEVLSAKKAGLQSVVFTFSLHPGNLFSDTEMKLIYTEYERRHQLEMLGIDVLVAFPFSKQTAKMDPVKFIEEILIEQLGAKLIVVGDDFHFGHGRSGDVELLKKYSETFGYELKVYNRISIDDNVVSSSLIRGELCGGNIEYVNQLLGKPYSIIGEVLHGRKLGRTLGMPTTNLIPESNKLLPPNGVYASKTIIDGIEYPGVTSIGYKPTVGAEPQIGVETYIFDYDNDLYGKTIEVALYKFERHEEKFDSIDQLKHQMEQDVLFAKDYFMKK